MTKFAREAKPAGFDRPVYRQTDYVERVTTLTQIKSEPLFCHTEPVECVTNNIKAQGKNKKIKLSPNKIRAFRL